MKSPLTPSLDLLRSCRVLEGGASLSNPEKATENTGFDMWVDDSSSRPVLEEQDLLSKIKIHFGSELTHNWQQLLYRA